MLQLKLFVPIMNSWYKKDISKPSLTTDYDDSSDVCGSEIYWSGHGANVTSKVFISEKKTVPS